MQKPQFKNQIIRNKEQISNKSSKAAFIVTVGKGKDIRDYVDLCGELEDSVRPRTREGGLEETITTYLACHGDGSKGHSPLCYVVLCVIALTVMCTQF